MISALVQTKGIKIKIVPEAGLEITLENKKQFLICHMKRYIPQSPDKEHKNIRESYLQPRLFRIIDFPGATRHCLEGCLYLEKYCKADENSENNGKTISIFRYIRVSVDAVIKCAQTPEHIHEALESVFRTRQEIKLPARPRITEI